MTKILLVEDDKSLREIYGVRLLAEGYDIVSAGDGEEALAMAIKERPNLIVSDVMMPKISGFDMLDILRSTTETKDIKVIMMTALSSEDQRLRGEKLGADRYLVKSQVGIEDVVRTVHEVLGDIPGMTTAAPQSTQAPMVQPVAPTAQPIPQPATVPPVSTPVATPQPEPTNSTLPQPTAPFSSPTPRPSGLGDRVIQPISTSDENSTDIASMLENELSGTAMTPVQTPIIPPVANPTPTSTPAPVPTPTTFAEPQTVQAPAVGQAITTTPPPAATTDDVQRPDIASLSPQGVIPQQPTPTPSPAPNAMPHSPVVSTQPPIATTTDQPQVPQQ